MSPISTVTEAEQALDKMTALIERLSELLEQETALVRSGQIRGAAAIEPTKSALAGELFLAGERLRANAKFLLQAVPARCTLLTRTQEAFRAILKKNMLVLATGHAVSESIVRRLSGDLARKASPQVYGSTGRTTGPNPRQGRPLAISRTL